MSLWYKAQTRFLFHAHIKIKIPVFYPDTCLDSLFDELERIDKLYNSYQSGSYIDKINQNAGSFVEVDDETIHLLRRAVSWSEFFGGAFDMTIMPLIRLWGFYKDDNIRVPSSQELADTLKKVDYRRIQFGDNRVRIAKDQEIITGSFLKAYAVDKVIDKMRELGIDDAIINAGGSTIRAVNSKIHPYWMVNVREADTDKLMCTLHLSDACYTTSSQKETYVTIDGKRYGHILNPVTGYPSGNRQIGIITDNCMDGDIISTGLFLQTPDKFKELLTKLQQSMTIEGFMSDGNGTICKSSGFDNYQTLKQ